MITHLLNQCKVRKRKGCFFSKPMLGLPHPGASCFSLTSGTRMLGSNLQCSSASSFDSKPISKVIFFGIIADYSFYGNWNTQYNDWKTLNFSPIPLHYCLGCFFCYERSWSLWLSRMSKVRDNRVTWKYSFSVACEYFTFYKIYARFAKYSQERKLTAGKCSRKHWAEINLSAYCANHIAKLGWCEIMLSIYSTCVGKMLLDIWNIFTLGFEAYWLPTEILITPRFIKLFWICRMR